MKILYFSAYEEDRGGGEGKITWELAHESVKAGNTVVMLAPNTKTTKFEKSVSGKLSLLLYPSLSILDQLFVLSLTPRVVSELVAFLDEFEPDIIHFHTAVSTVFLLEAWAISHHKVVVHSLHEDPNKMLSYAAFKEESLLHAISKKAGVDKYLQTLYKYTDCVVSVNDLHNEPIRKFGYKGPMVTIFNGRDLEKFTSLPLANVHSRPIKLFFVGFIAERKNQHFLIHALKELPSYFELYFIGEPVFQSYLEKLPKDPRVHYLGQKRFVELPALMQEFHICVSASIEEAFSLSIIEALAAGRPVVGLSNATIDRLITDKNGVNLPLTTTPKQFAAAVEKLAQRSQKDYETLAKDARLTVGDLDWKNAMAKYQQLYENLLITKRNQHKVVSTGTLDRIIATLLGEGKITDMVESLRQRNRVLKLKTIGTVTGTALAALAMGITTYQLLRRSRRTRK